MRILTSLRELTAPLELKNKSACLSIALFVRANLIMVSAFTEMEVKHLTEFFKKSLPKEHCK